MASNEFRIEHDFLGDREVPADAYYGVQTLRGAENFPITGYRIHPALIRAMGIVKKAAALANRDSGHLEPKIADAIALEMTSPGIAGAKPAKQDHIWKDEDQGEH